MSSEARLITLQDTENLLHFVIPEPPKPMAGESLPGEEVFGAGAGCIGNLIDAGCLPTLPIDSGCLGFGP